MRLVPLIFAVIVTLVTLGVLAHSLGYYEPMTYTLGAKYAPTNDSR